MNEWINGSMNKWMDKCFIMNEWLDGWMFIDKWISVQMDNPLYELVISQWNPENRAL